MRQIDSFENGIDQSGAPSDEGQVPAAVFGDADESTETGSTGELSLRIKILRACGFASSSRRRITHMDDEGRIRRAGLLQEQSLRKWYARLLLFGMAAQVAFANVIFWRYSTALDWEMPSEVVIAWLSGTVVEIIGLVVIVTRYLFPRDPKAKAQEDDE